MRIWSPDRPFDHITVNDSDKCTVHESASRGYVLQLSFVETAWEGMIEMRRKTVCLLTLLGGMMGGAGAGGENQENAGTGEQAPADEETKKED